jgi:hypothetical protein
LLLPALLLCQPACNPPDYTGPVAVNSWQQRHAALN